MYTTELDLCYEKGLSDERKVMDFLRGQGYNVKPASSQENKKEDIDCWVNGKPVSIKSSHKGAKFKNIGLELANQLTSRVACRDTEYILGKLSISLLDVDTLIDTGSWEPGWYATGKATNYLFYQEHELRLYTKKSIENYVNSKGFLRVRQLSDACKSYLGGRYRYCNTICGYLHWNVIPHRLWNI
ncbi:MAG: hypothetical protein KME59_21500 [Trichormus sp. ATA11-4-KO1]|jgi:hypothetical protein|nr:hypothetical protein [Trichormus sp. ATA11-4-KO1]